MVKPDISWNEVLQDYTERTGLPGFPKALFSRRSSGFSSALLQSSMIGQYSVEAETPEVPAGFQYRIGQLDSTIKSLKKELAACRNQINSLCADLKATLSIKQTELFDIGESFELIHSIPIVLEESEDEVIASFPEVELFAVGSTESEAILNLKSSIIELFSDLTGTPKNKLGKLPLSWFRILNKVIKPIGKS
jgi:hypothetical protein